MCAPWDEDFDNEINVKKIKHLYELRHACNLFGSNHVSKESGIPMDRLVALCNSDVHGSEDLKQFLRLSHNEFVKLIKEYEKETAEHQQRIQAVHEKNERLV